MSPPCLTSGVAAGARCAGAIVGNGRAAIDGILITYSSRTQRPGRCHLSKVTESRRCQQRGLHLFVLPPRSPKLNGAVERANRTHTEEFYQVTACSLEMKKLNRELRQWEKIYNTVRNNQSLGYLTPHDL